MSVPPVDSREVTFLGLEEAADKDTELYVYAQDKTAPSCPLPSLCC